MIAIFIGPTLARARVERLLAGTPAVILPPAAQGDVYRAARQRPATIALVDGYFHQVPAVWHKEILWALKEGIPVIGASSMGALRAAELEPFGMIGVGAIFEAYLDGSIVDDDEVALLHGPAEVDFLALSEPLVNIRATLAAARKEGVISPDTCEVALQTARAMYYPERTYDALIDRLISQGHDLGHFKTWLAGGRVDQKALDAEALISKIASWVERPAQHRSWTFEHTAMWDELIRLHGSRAAAAHETKGDDVLRELRKDPDKWRGTMIAALGRMLAGDASKREGRSVDERELVDALEKLRRRHELSSPAELERWLTVNDLTTDGLIELLANQVRSEWMVANLEADLEPHALEHLKLTGTYPAIRP